jgi:TolB-like protein
MSGIKNTLLALLTGTLFFSGCVAQAPDVYPLISHPLSGPKTLDMQGSSYQAADAMLVRILGKFRMRGGGILPASFVDEREMEKTTPFGRLISRQFANRFTQAGYNMVEVKLRKNFLLQQGQGQFILTRELEKIRDSHKVNAVLAGSYVTTKRRIFVSAQLVRLKDGVTLAAEDFDLPLTKDIESLLVE